MKRQRQRPTAPLGLATALAALAACGGADRTVAPGQPVATDTVHVSPDSLALDLSGVDSLTARLVDTTGAPVEGTVEWTVRDTTKVRRIVTMVKAVDRTMVIGDVKLVSKTKRPSHNS